MPSDSVSPDIRARFAADPASLPPDSQAAIPLLLSASDTFVHRHIGPSGADIRRMLETIGVDSLQDLVEQTVPESIRLRRPLNLGEPRGEHELLEELAAIAAKNRVVRSCIGMGYSDCITPPVILRNILENPGWYTQYTPYQAEISQGRLEALLNFQTMVADLTGLPLANASMLDEATAAAEAMAMCHSIQERATQTKTAFFVADDCHPQTIEVVRSRAVPLGFECVVGDWKSLDLSDGRFFGLLVQYPATCGTVHDFSGLFERARAAGTLTVVAADLLALTLLKPPGELGADVAVGSAQRFGVPLGYGGPHAAYMATRSEYVRRLPGRLIGVSRDAAGKPALRLTLQTREQHIRREKATSNICTAQVLLAVMAGMYAVYHGPEGLRRIARRIRGLTSALAAGLRGLGFAVRTPEYFDTLVVQTPDAAAVIASALARGYNLRPFPGHGLVGVSLDETTTKADVEAILAAFAGRDAGVRVDDLAARGEVRVDFQGPLARTSSFLAHPVFNLYHSEHELLRYIHRLQSRDLSLTTSMIPLGSCTMKLNGTSEMLPVTWPQFGRIHPFAPRDQAEGYRILFAQLEAWLSEITGFAAVSIQPNAGSQGEYTGLLVIRAYHRSRGEPHRNICLIPESAHGTNPASAVVAGFRVVVVRCDERGNVDLADLEAKASQHAAELAALMITYPSTHGVFEESIKDICRIVHEHGGQVYMDGANMNAQVGLCRPGDIGADVCHLNLHKTFCIPHGGGGPGMGPIGVASHLAPFLPGHGVVRPDSAGAQAIGAVSAAPWGSASILTISWVYIALMGAAGLTRATQVAILNANYMARRLEGHYKVLYTGRGGRVAHEFIIDCRPFEQSSGVKVEDIAKRLMDYGFHAPTMSWPVPGTLMIEPTESESKEELDRLCDALILIRQEIRDIEEGRLDRVDNPLKNAPHPAEMLLADDWSHKYGRERAAYPVPWLRKHKFWPAVRRVDNPYGDRNLVCSCPPASAY